MSEKCVHRWMLDSTSSVEMSPEDKLRRPNCIGRHAVCKKCDAKSVQIEKIWDTIWHN